MGTMRSSPDGSLCHIHNTNVSDSNLRNEVKTLPNGSYAKMICRGCGVYTVGEDGDHTTAEIVSRCKVCFVPE